jgi:hypothetical protein
MYGGHPPLLLRFSVLNCCSHHLENHFAKDMPMSYRGRSWVTVLVGKNDNSMYFTLFTPIDMPQFSIVRLVGKQMAVSTAPHGHEYLTPTANPLTVRRSSSVSDHGV